MNSNTLTYPAVSCFKGTPITNIERPDEAARYIVERNIDQLVTISIKEATEFVNTSHTKLKGLEQLKYTVLMGESAITKHVETIMKSLVRIWQMEIDRSQDVIKQIVQIIGYHVKSDYYVPLIANILTHQDYKSNHKNTIIMLNFLGHLLKYTPSIGQHLEHLLKMCQHYQAIFCENDEGIIAISQIIITFIRTWSQPYSQLLINVAFNILLDVISTTSIPISNRQQAMATMQQLSRNGGFNSVAELHAQQIGPILQQVLTTKAYHNWGRTTKDRFKFDTIVRNCHSEVGRHLEGIIEILQWMISPQSDLEMRMDTLVLVEYMLTVQQIRQLMKPLGERIIKKLLIVSIQWKVGKPQIKIRKAGVINMMNTISYGVVNEEQLLDCFKDLLPALKNCLTDDWAPQLRLASCELVEKYLLATRDNIGDDELRELYPSLLERLDDSQDPIRKKVTTAINVFFTCRYLKFSQSTLQYMVNSIFVHFDDNNQEIQQAIGTTLKFAAKVDYKLVSNAANAHMKRMKHQDRCKEIIEYCEQIMEENKLQ